MTTIFKDLQYGIRVLLKNPAFSIVAVVALAMGIGANTAIFSLVDSLLIRPLPVKDAEQIMVLGFRQNHGRLGSNFSIATFRDIREQTASVFSNVTGYRMGLDGLSVNGKAERILTNYVPGDFFSALGLQPTLGRLFRATEGDTPGADPIMVLSYSYWKNHFGADPKVVGSKVKMNGHPVTVVGIAPVEFHGLYSFVDTQAYLPLSMEVIEDAPPDFMANRKVTNFSVVARLRPEVPLRRARALLAVVSERIGKEHTEDEKGLEIEAYPEVSSRPNPDPKNQVALIGAIFLGLAVLVLLLACANVTNILLVRATVREREMAIRSALGAARSSLIRQLVTESLILALAGGFGGVLLGLWASATLSSLQISTDLPVRLDFGFDWRVFCYALTAALITGVVVGVFPALRASHSNLNEVLHRSGRGIVSGRNRFRNALVMAQVGGSLMLLIIAGLFVRSLSEAEGKDMGFDPSHVLNLSMDPNEIGYNEAQGRAFYESLLDRVRGLPGVVAASTAASVPMGYYSNDDELLIEGYVPPKGEAAPHHSYNVVSPDYFSTMKIKLLSGRSFENADDLSAPYVAVVSEALAKKYWPGKEAIGQSFKIAAEPGHAIRIVGVAHDVRSSGISRTILPFFYLPFRQHYASNSLETLQVRTVGNPDEMRSEIQKTVARLAPDLPVFDVKPMSAAIYTLNGLMLFQIGAVFATALGMLGLILAVVGIYGVISYAVSQQTHEIGLRMALGARPSRVLGMVLGKGLLIVGIGLVIGIGTALAAATVVGSFLVVSPTDPLTYFAVSGLLCVVALFACYVPARRAMRVDPMVALRHE